MNKRQQALSDMNASLAEVCPACGECILGFLDIFGDDLVCPPCCDFGAAMLEECGFFVGMDHRERVALIEAATGQCPREVLDLEDGWKLLPELRIDLETVKGSRASVFQFVQQHHRHHGPPVADKFRLAAYAGGERVGVAVVGRPVSRMLDDGSRLEVIRVATIESYRAHHAASALYGAAARQAQKLGYRILQTYILESERGTSLKAAGFVPVCTTKGGSWDRRARPRTDKAPTCPKVRWERTLRPAGVHADRAPGGDRDHRHAGRHGACGLAQQPADRP